MVAKNVMRKQKRTITTNLMNKTLYKILKKESQDSM